MRRRDSTRQKVYDAEFACPMLNYIQDFKIEQAQRWVNRFCKSTWAKSKWPGKAYGYKILRNIPVIFEPRLTAYGGQANNNGIDIGPSGMNHPYIILHELSHVLIERTKRNAAPHGREFLDVLKALIGHYISVKAVKCFERALKRRGV